MGRPGAGSGGGRSSSGGHSSSRSSGGHRVGGSSSGSRPMGRSSSGSSSMRSMPSYGGGRRPTMPPPPPPRPPVRHHSYYGGSSGGYRRGSSNIFGTILAFIMVFLLLCVCVTMFNRGGSSIPASTQARTKFDGYGFYNDCVIDERGWIDNISRTESRLKEFYDKTGIRPFVYIKKYDPALMSDTDKEAWAVEWYDENSDWLSEGAFVYFYFSDANDDSSDVPGYMCYVNGKQASSVMDAEAVDVFWAYIDEYWYSNRTMDDVIVDAFQDTASRIMTKTTTAADIGKYVVILAIIMALVAGTVIIMKIRRKHEAERNAETERILNSDIHSL